MITIFFVSLNKFSEVKHRYYNDLVAKLQNKEKRENYIYFKIYRSGFEVFKNILYLVLETKLQNRNLQKDKEKNKIIIASLIPTKSILNFYQNTD